MNWKTSSDQTLESELRVSVIDALKSITSNGTYQYFEEKSKGSPDLGKLADLVILDKNPFKVEPIALTDIRVVETIKEGWSICKARWKLCDWRGINYE